MMVGGGAGAGVGLSLDSSFLFNSVFFASSFISFAIALCTLWLRQSMGCRPLSRFLVKV